MSISNKSLSCAEIKNMDIVNYLSSLGFEPTRISRHHYWYLSPFRNERTASFKVNRALNKWYDFGEGHGGNLIDFGILYFKCSISEFLHQFCFAGYGNQQPFLNQDNKKKEEKQLIQIENIKNIESPALLGYLKKRKIDAEIAQQFCKEVTFTLYGKNYYAIGFQNDTGGYELRNEFFKGSSHPKDITTINNGQESLSVFEGFFDFLSYLTIHKNSEELLHNFLILNSLSFLQKTKTKFSSYKQTNLFFDRDKSGQKGTADLLSLGCRIIDRSYLYCHYKDLNDWLIHFGLTYKSPLEKDLPTIQTDSKQ